MFDGIEVRRISGQELKNMACFQNRIPDVLPLVKCGVVHHNHGRKWQLRQQVLHSPSMEGIGIHICLKQPNSQKNLSDQSPYDVGSALGVPIANTVTTRPFAGVSMCSRHILRKAAFVNIDNFSPRRFMRCNLLLKDTPFFVVRLRMAQRFFYS